MESKVFLPKNPVRPQIDREVLAVKYFAFGR